MEPIEHKRDYSPPNAFDFEEVRNFNSARVNKEVIDSAVQRLFEDSVRRKELKERTQLLCAKRELEELR